MADMVKETPAEYASRLLRTAGDLIRHYGKQVDWSNGVGTSETIKTELASLAESQDYNAVSGRCKEVMEMVTTSRVLYIRSIIARQWEAWNKGQYAEPFSKTPVAEATVVWLKGIENGETKAVLDWISAGWELLRGKTGLNSPWGFCDRTSNHSEDNPGKILPRKRANSEEWKIFSTCPSCHAADIEQKNVRAAVTRGEVYQAPQPTHRVVSKPGSARRRHSARNRHAENEEGFEKSADGQNKRNRRREREARIGEGE